MIELKHPRTIRWCHWINFPLIFLMIWSGLLIYWANDVYRLGLGNLTIMKFFPDSFYDALGIGHRLAEGMAWHFFFQWLFILNGIVYVVYTFWSGEWRFLIPNRKSFLEAWQVLLHDLRLSKKIPPLRKFNGAQQIAYTTIILCGAGSIVSGLAIYKPVQLSGLTAILGGYDNARWIHFVLTVIYILFFIVHLIQVARAGWNNLRAMITGYEIK
jgi:thiosulfate reductase cytochrome b subunit